MHRMPKVSHQRCGEVWRQVFTEEYAKTCAVINHTIENVLVMRLNLTIKAKHQYKHR